MSELTRQYGQLWQSAAEAFAAGQPELDPYLARPQPDLRRGMTLIARPGPAVSAEVERMLARLAAIEPEQYYYPTGDFHATVLSLFTATAQPQPFLARRAEYLRAIEPIVREAGPFEIAFRGVCASPGAVLIQGFPTTPALEHLRERLRGALHAAGLGAGLDLRYRLTTAHMTVMRFRAPPRDLPGFVAALAVERERDFGTASIRTLAAVENDWYMAAQNVNELRSYELASFSCD